MKARFRAKPIVKAAVLAGVSLISLGVPLVTGAQPSSATVTAPAWEPDPQALGNVAFYDSSGNFITSGTDLSHLFDYAAATTGPTAGSVKATLFFAAPNSGKPTSSWAVAQTSSSTAFPNSSYPAPLTGPGFTNPVVKLIADNDDGDLNAALGGFVLDNTSGYANLIQVRLKDTNSGTHYWESDIAYNQTGSPTTVDGVDVPANGWALVYPQPSSTTTGVASIATTTYGQEVTYTATVSPAPPGGTVAFADGGTTIPSCAAQPVDSSTGESTCTLTPAAGDHTITAGYSGSLFDASSQSSSQPETVNQAATTVDLTSVPGTTTVGTQVTYTATISVTSPGSGSPTGTVTFADGSGNPATSNCADQTVSNGAATCTVTYSTADTYSVTATYNGDTNFSASPTSNTLTETINPSPTTTTVTASPNPGVTGQQVSITATISPAADGGTVDFSAGATSLCSAVTVASGQAVCDFTFDTGGSYDIVGSYSGNGSFGASDNSGSPYTEVIKTATTTVISPTAASVSGQSVTYTATVTGTGGTPTGHVAFNDGAGNPATTACASQPVSAGVATCTVTYPTAGTYTVNASYGGDSDFAGSDATSVDQTVDKADTTTGVTAAPGSTTVTGQQVTYTATVTANAPGTGTPTGTVTFTDGTGTPATTACSSRPVSAGTAICTVTYTSANSYPVNATYNGDSNYNSSAATPASQTVDPASTTTQMSASSGSSYTGQSVTYTATVAPVAPGAGSPTGTVAFDDGAGHPATTGCASQPITAGHATCTVTYASAGDYSVKATYSGDANFDTSSSSSSAHTVTVPTAPGAPTGLQAAPGSGQVTLSWTAPASNGGSAITGYDVYVGTTPSGEAATPSNGALITGTTFIVKGLDNGTRYYFTVKAVNAVGSSVASGEAAATPSAGSGYLMVGRDGGIFAFGGAHFHGSLGGIRLAAPIIGMAETPDKGGYWLAGADGGVFRFGDAGFYGSLGGVHLVAPIVAIVATPSGHGYWLVASDGGVFGFGDAGFYGSLGGIHLVAPIVGMVASPSGHGYLLAAADGGVFRFGDGLFDGSLGGIRLAAPVVAIALTPTGHGYWLVAADGGVFRFGDAPFSGSLGGIKLAAPVISILPTGDGLGYWLIGTDAGVFSFGDAVFRGSLGGLEPAGAIVGGAIG